MKTSVDLAKRHRLAVSYAWAKLLCITMMSIFLVSLDCNVAIADEGILPSLRFTVAGPSVTVFDWKTQHCARSDIPDASARAFRDIHGKVHLYASSNQARAFIGDSLESLHHVCGVSYEGGHSKIPAAFEDEGWLESFFAVDGHDVIALVSMDYHPARHALPCGNDGTTSGLCWYSAITLAKSSDGGTTFSDTMTEDHVVIAPRRKFDSTRTQPQGAFVPSNIIKVAGDFFVLVSVSDTANGRGGECLFRSADIEKASSWRAWDGQSYSVRPEKPYQETDNIGTSSGSLCSPIKSLAGSPVRTLLKIAKGGYLAISVASLPSTPKGLTVVGQTSRDLVNWSSPIEVAHVPIYRANGGAIGQSAFYYPSIIDPNSKSLSFDSLDSSSVFLFLTRITYGAGIDRDLVRIPIQVTNSTSASSP